METPDPPDRAHWGLPACSSAPSRQHQPRPGAPGSAASGHLPRLPTRQSRTPCRLRPKVPSLKSPRQPGRSAEAIPCPPQPGSRPSTSAPSSGFHCHLIFPASSFSIFPILPCRTLWPDRPPPRPSILPSYTYPILQGLEPSPFCPPSAPKGTAFSIKPALLRRQHMLDMDNLVRRALSLMVRHSRYSVPVPFHPREAPTGGAPCQRTSSSMFISLPSSAHMAAASLRTHEVLLWLLRLLTSAPLVTMPPQTVWPGREGCPPPHCMATSHSHPRAAQVLPRARSIPRLPGPTLPGSQGRGEAHQMM